MGFASPANDYVERQLSPEVICNMGAESRVLETDVGFAIIERHPKARPAMCCSFYVKAGPSSSSSWGMLSSRTTAKR